MNHDFSLVPITKGHLVYCSCGWIGARTVGASELITFHRLREQWLKHRDTALQIVKEEKVGV